MTEDSRPDLFQIPEFCPVCSGPTAIIGDFLYCNDTSCPSRLIGSLKVWIRNLGLLNIGDATIEALAELPNVSSVADLYRLTIDDWTDCCSGRKMADKCYAALHSNKSLPLELILASINIPNFGLSTATDLVTAGFDTADKIISASFDELVAVPNIGEKTARQIQEGILERKELLLDLLEVLEVKKISGGPLKGKSVCITGDLSKPRKTVQKMIMDAGGTVQNSVSKGTTYLVTNDTDTTSKKMMSAKKNGATIISEQQLMDLMSISS
jgi:DNA ligase (NAD+)